MTWSEFFDAADACSSCRSSDRPWWLTRRHFPASLACRSIGKLRKMKRKIELANSRKGNVQTSMKEQRRESEWTKANNLKLDTLCSRSEAQATSHDAAHFECLLWVATLWKHRRRTICLVWVVSLSVRAKFFFSSVHRWFWKFFRGLKNVKLHGKRFFRGSIKNRFITHRRWSKSTRRFIYTVSQLIAANVLPWNVFVHNRF